MTVLTVISESKAFGMDDTVILYNMLGAGKCSKTGENFTSERGSAPLPRGAFVGLDGARLATTYFEIQEEADRRVARYTAAALRDDYGFRCDLSLPSVTGGPISQPTTFGSVSTRSAKLIWLIRGSVEHFSRRRTVSW